MTVILREKGIHRKITENHSYRLIVAFIGIVIDQMGGCQEIESRLHIIVGRQGAVVGNDLSYFILPVLVTACVNAFPVNPILH